MEFELQPYLRGNLVELHPLRAEDFETLFQAASDPLIWEQHPESDRYKREVFQKFFDGAIESKGAFAVMDSKTGRMIGSSRYADYKPAESEIEIGWTFLERAFWGGAYNGEMKSLMLNHAFRFVRRVVFRVGEHNLRSQKALRKLGAEVRGRTEVAWPDGSVKAHLIFALER
jgi:RimJ/RimL family protein N-acetyltransferase